MKGPNSSVIYQTGTTSVFRLEPGIFKTRVAVYHIESVVSSSYICVLYDMPEHAVVVERFSTPQP